MNGKQRHCFDPGRKEGRKGANFVLVKRGRHGNPK